MRKENSNGTQNTPPAENSHFYEYILDGVQDGITFLNTDMTIRYANQTMKQWYKDKLPLEGKKCFEVYQNQSAPCDPCPAIRSIESGQTERDEVQGLPGASTAFIQLFSYPIKDAGGTVTGVVEFVRDITDHKKVQEKLRNSEILNNSLFKHLPQRIFIKDQNSKYLSCNSNYAQDLGINTKDIVGKDDYAFFPAEMAERYRADDREVMSGKKIKDVEERYRVGKNELWVRTIKVPYLNNQGELMGVLGIFEDITKRRQAEDALLQQNRFQKMAVDISSDFISVDSTTIDDKINGLLKKTGEFFDVDRGYLFLFSEENTTITNTYEWCSSGTQPQKDILQNLPIDTLPWWKEKILAGNAVHIPDIEQLPSEARAEKNEFNRQGIKSLVSVPVLSHERVIGFFCFHTIRQFKNWNNGHIDCLKLLANIIFRAHQKVNFEQALKRNEERLNSILNSIDDVVASLSLKDEKVSYLSPSVEKLFGRRIESFSENRHQGLDHVHPDDIKIVMAGYNRLNDNHAYEAEYRIIRDDGSIRWIRDRSKIIYDATGEPDRADRLITDITEKKLMEVELRKSQEKLNSILNSLEEVVLSFSLEENKIIYLSPSIETLLGKKIDEFTETKRVWFESVHPDDKQIIENSYTELAENDFFDARVRVLRTDGSIRWVHNRLKRIKDETGKPIRIDALISDITDQKLAEDALMFQKKFQTMVADISSRFVKSASQHLEDNIYLALEEIGQFFGVDRCYVVRFSRDLTIMTPASEWVGQDIEPRAEKVQSCPTDRFPWMVEEIKKNRPVQITDIEDLPEKASSEKRSFQQSGVKSIICFPLIIQDELIGFMGLNSIKHKKKFGDGERAILRVVAEIIAGAILRQQIENEILDAKRKAEEANLSKSRFLSNMSHEIRTPMAGILGLIDMVIKTADNPEHIRLLDLIKTSSNSLLNIINDILDISKVEAGKIDLSYEDFRLDMVLEKTISLFSVIAVNKGLALTVETADDVPNVLFGDPHRLEQILKNLVSNALKFTLKGGCLIKVSPDPSSDSKYDLLFEVRDTGIGIPPALIPNLFQSFTQADSSYAKKYGGTGLGLALSKNLVELMGGRMWAESGKDVGTSFCFTASFQKGFIKEGETEASVKTPQDLKKTEAALKFLVAEDVDINQEYISFLLSEAGYDFEIVSNGAEALAVYKKGQFDIVLMDVQMPEMDGVETTRQIRSIERNEKRSRTPIIALTAYAMQDEREKIMEAGMDGYVVKPIDPELLTSEINRVLAERFSVSEGDGETDSPY